MSDRKAVFKGFAQKVTAALITSPLFMIGDADVEAVEEIANDYVFEEMDIVSYYSQTVHHIGFVTYNNENGVALFHHFWPSDGVRVDVASAFIPDDTQKYKVHCNICYDLISR